MDFIKKIIQPKVKDQANYTPPSNLESIQEKDDKSVTSEISDITTKTKEVIPKPLFGYEKILPQTASPIPNTKPASVATAVNPETVQNHSDLFKTQEASNESRKVYEGEGIEVTLEGVLEEKKRTSNAGIDTVNPIQQQSSYEYREAVSSSARINFIETHNQPTATQEKETSARKNKLFDLKISLPQEESSVATTVNKKNTQEPIEPVVPDLSKGRKDFLKKYFEKNPLEGKPTISASKAEQVTKSKENQNKGPSL